ncbi:hypothetical protein Ga0102493_112042 [Erythrobacter litoralis]|uniref:Uncharacterized protein n=1 Tax=Erythrobacter litoralis TaxID=39960 RepID=A0A074MHX8_9SPHN|nr:hypothetical protein [Erythrobacter litoralis]AOL23061.1 hypothetical protein Ga0102493_112042 [Erythrobacter litoralis]KEO93074.1 hypothetical protein EH32_12670 [Erythrobacter litoralis]
MSDVDGLMLGLGLMVAGTSLGAILRPDLLVKESRSNRDARLRELDAGAPEAFFEERRELEAYPPRFDLSHRTLRILGAAGLALGIAAMFAGFAR